MICGHCGSLNCQYPDNSIYRVPNFGRNALRFQIARADEKAKKLRDRALAEAFIQADLNNGTNLKAPGGWNEARANYAYLAFERLIARTRRT